MCRQHPTLTKYLALKCAAAVFLSLPLWADDGGVCFHWLCTDRRPLSDPTEGKLLMKPLKMRSGLRLQDVSAVFTAHSFSAGTSPRPSPRPRFTIPSYVNPSVFNQRFLFLLTEAVRTLFLLMVHFFSKKTSPSPAETAPLITHWVFTYALFSPNLNDCSWPCLDVGAPYLGWI